MGAISAIGDKSEVDWDGSLKELEEAVTQFTEVHIHLYLDSFSAIKAVKQDISPLIVTTGNNNGVKKWRDDMK